MASFKVLRNGENSQVQVNTSQFTWLFDCHSSIYGKNFRFASFKDPHKPLKFVVRCLDDIDSVFITNSKSIGAMFLKNTKIYLTRPVFEQILLRYEQLKSLTVSYDGMNEEEIIEKFFSSDFNTPLKYIKSDEKHADDHIALDQKIIDSVRYKIVQMDDIDLEEFKNNVIFIKYNQIVEFDDYVLQSVPCGTFLGWCNYQIIFPNTKSILILTSYSHKRRFSIEAAPIKADYLIINREYGDDFGPIELFSKYIREYALRASSSIKPLAMPVDLPTFFIEVLVHVLSVIDQTGVPITIVSEFFTKLDLLLNVHSEWLNNDFFSIAEPFPVRKYCNLRVVESLKEVEMHKNFVFFCIEQYEMVKDSISDNFEIVLINNSKAGLQALENVKHVSNSYKIPKNEKHQFECLPGVGLSNDNAALTKEAYASFKSFNFKIESTDHEILLGYQGCFVKDQYFFVESENSKDYIMVDSLLPIINELRSFLW
ncbi:uncharacterized protein VICG_01637 [Vittaforma corneae ATCC 50505]|uniref:Uncharacterized protein n=1 Tax=Vittaforma corneae (strain ATCC 50505) TaxID=993615 RepID=L2GKL6_VITCO|nr:uncharacterized protein VICG_01637 [Vittaforma corneae ATCC 50505]ELA41396.1 hypothetical protein VICG_01637 [Vittaforma corneae ATCC 50505]